MEAISMNTTSEKFVISLDKGLFQVEYVLSLVEKLRMEHLAQSVDFGKDIENIGIEIKSDCGQQIKKGFWVATNENCNY